MNYKPTVQLSLSPVKDPSIKSVIWDTGQVENSHVWFVCGDMLKLLGTAVEWKEQDCSTRKLLINTHQSKKALVIKSRTQLILLNLKYGFRGNKVRNSAIQADPLKMYFSFWDWVCSNTFACQMRSRIALRVSICKSLGISGDQSLLLL